MTNNTLLCGIVLVGIGLFAYFKDAPDDKWDEARVALADKLTAEAQAKDSTASKVDPDKINKKDQFEAAKAALAEKNSVDPATVMNVSPTALIPVGFGLVLLACAGLVIWKEPLRKGAMHVAAGVAILGVLAGFYPLIKHRSFDWNVAGVRSGLLMSLVCLVFVVTAVMSFMEARAARTSPPSPAV